MTTVQAGRARQPQQRRARERFEKVLEAAGGLLLERGFDGFTIAELATRLGHTRASIYKFFPTPQALFNELNARQLDLLEDDITAAAQALGRSAWAEQLRLMARSAADFHNNHPLARLLILGATPGEDNYRSRESTIQRLGQTLRRILEDQQLGLPAEPVDHAMLTVEIGTCCLRTSFFLHGRITDDYARAAGQAMVAYLEQHLQSRNLPH